MATDPFGVKAIAGGTAVVLMLRQGLIHPDELVDLRQLDGLRPITVVEGALEIGSLATLSGVAESTLVRRHAPGLASACGLVGNVRVRNVATIGGNIAEADYASDPPAVLVSLGAECEIFNDASGFRVSAIEDVFTGFFSTSLQPGDIITRVRIPLAAHGHRSAYVKYVSRSSEDRPCVGVAVSTVVAEGAISGLSVAVGAVSDRPVILPSITDPYLGQHTLTRQDVEQIAYQYAEGIDPVEDARGSSWYRTRMIQTFVARALEEIGYG